MDRAFGQFEVWATGEADFDVMDAQTKGFAHNVWGMILDDVSFEGAFDDFLSRVIQHPLPGRDTPASLPTLPGCIGQALDGIWRVQRERWAWIHPVKPNCLSGA